MLPFDLPQVSRGFAALDPGARAAGREAALGAARAVGEVLGFQVSLAGLARPAVPAEGVAMHRMAVELAALPGTALVEVEPLLVARLVDLLCAAGAPPPGAAALTPLEETALELLILAAIDGARQVPVIDERLAPRLARGAPPDGTRPAGSPLVVDLEVAAGPVRGRARLLLPPAAALALRPPAVLEEPLASFPLFASLRGGRAPLTAAELAALAPGDVVLTDPPPDGRHRLVFPGGLTAVGPVAGGALTVERTEMDDRLAEIPVTLEVELARVPLTLADLARLEPGSTLPLCLDRRGLVTLRLGERALARGELVDVDGAVGVRILSMELRWNPAPARAADEPPGDGVTP